MQFYNTTLHHRHRISHEARPTLIGLEQFKRRKNDST
jgi:hypothetical protein